MGRSAQSRKTASVLGWLGLLPFPALAVAVYTLPGPYWRFWLSAYGLIIISFLAGAWWGIALIRSEPGILLASNAIVVLGWFAFLLSGRWFLLIAALLLVLLHYIEQRHRVFAPQRHYYRRLRLRLTGIAALSLIAAFPAAATRPGEYCYQWTIGSSGAQGVKHG